MVELKPVKLLIKKEENFVQFEDNEKNILKYNLVDLNNLHKLSFIRFKRIFKINKNLKNFNKFYYLFYFTKFRNPKFLMNILCGCCTEIVTKPVYCSKCLRLFCSDCIKRL